MPKTKMEMGLGMRSHRRHRDQMKFFLVSKIICAFCAPTGLTTYIASHVSHVHSVDMVGSDGEAPSSRAQDQLKGLLK